jgi:tRNA(Leu) C34 or U34 (ribose-2'-O)-methylase TrmL
MGDFRRGYCAIGLHNPKNGFNVGGVMRSVGCCGADLVIIDGPRQNKFMRHPTDTQNAWKHVPVQWVSDIFDVLPYSCVPVAVDIVPGATPLPEFTHPERACYLFGAEDATLGEKTLSRCARAIVIPSLYCFNLAVAASIVMYDRNAKRGMPALEESRLRANFSA